MQATHTEGVRYRHARFMPDGKDLVLLSDESGELEFELQPANGVGAARSLTANGKVFRFEGVPSPDGLRLAFHDKNQELWLLDIKAETMQRIDASAQKEFRDLRWSPDSQWLAYARVADNTYTQLWVYGVQQNAKTAVTSDRVNSTSPAWSPDGKWLYVLSARNLQSAVGSPWGANQPEPFFDKPTKVYLIALKDGLRSPFEPRDELQATKKDDKKEDKKEDKKNGAADAPEKKTDGRDAGSARPGRRRVESLPGRTNALPGRACGAIGLHVPPA